jgi:hypothetical protein
LKIKSYEVQFVHKKFNMFVEDKHGELMRIKMLQILVTLTHESGDVVVFKRHKHCGKWKWSDSRMSGSCTSEHVISELARMLFDGRVARTREFLTCGLDGQATID